jgi:hypothetical protein
VEQQPKNAVELIAIEPPVNEIAPPLAEDRKLKTEFERLRQEPIVPVRREVIVLYVAQSART